MASTSAFLPARFVIDTPSTYCFSNRFQHSAAEGIRRSSVPSMRLAMSPVEITASAHPTVWPARTPPSSGSVIPGSALMARTIAALTSREETLSSPRNALRMIP